MTKTEAKRYLLGILRNFLDNGDDLFPEDISDDTLECAQKNRAFDAARKELSKEFARRRGSQ